MSTQTLVKDLLFPNIQRIILQFAAGLPLTANDEAELAAFRKRCKYHSDLPELFSDPNWIAEQLSEDFPDEETTKRAWEVVSNAIWKKKKR